MTKQTKKPPFLIIFGVLMINFLGLFSETALNIALPAIGGDFHVSAGQTQWLVLGYTLVIGIVLPLTTLISRWVKVQHLLVFSAVVFILGAVLAAWAPNFWWLFSGRTIQGISTGLFMPLLFAITLQVYPKAKIGTAMGIIAIVMNFAPAIGPSLAGAIVNLLSWRWIFLLFIPFSLLALILILMTVPDVIAQTRPKIDWPSVLYSAFGFGLLITTVGLFSNLGFGRPALYGLLLIAAIFVGAYIRRQLRLQTPVLNLRIFKTRKYAVAAIISGLNFATVMAAMYIIPQMLQSGLGATVSVAGLILLPSGLVNAGISLVAGRLYDSFGAQHLVRGGALLALLGVLMLLGVRATTSVAYVIGATTLLLGGSGLLLSPAQSYGLSDLSGADSNDGSTIMNTLQQVLGALSVSISTTALLLGQTTVSQHNPAVTYMAGVHTSFYWVALLVVLLVLAAWQVKEKR